MPNNELKQKLKEQANKLPLKPGVYLMRNINDEVIYVGKAKALKNRVTQYFGSDANHSAKVIKMVQNVQRFDTIICDTEYEALILENSLIKQYQPKYNILLKDDKGYHYVKVTNETWPKIEAVKTILNDGAEYIGPYYSANIVKQTVDETLKVFKLPNCNRSFDKPTKPCLNYHIGICFAPCKISTNMNEYRKTVKSAVEYIKKGGYNDADIAVLKKEMMEASDKLNFETAAKLRDRITAIEKSKEKQKVIISAYDREDIFATATVGEMACVTVFVFRNGHLSDQKQFFLEGAKNKSDYYSEFLQQYYQQTNDIPPHIAIDAKFDEIELLEQWLSDLKGKKVEITVPQKGVQSRIVNMCLTNSAQSLSQTLERNARETTVLNELATLLGLNEVPRRIESYDISNTAGTNNVGTMVVFTDGRPDKKLYRKFKIKSFMGQDDFRSLSEIIERRINEYYKGEDESFKTLPNLILLDGGKGQLSAVKEVLERHNLDSVSVFGMVKDSKHKTRAITAGGDDIQIKANRKAFTFVTQIQDEVHRFAISYHHNRNRMSTLQLELTKIDGVGEKTAKKLINSFKSVKKIKTATAEDFKQKGFSEKLAEKIIKYYSENN